MSDEPVKVCEKCGEPVKRLLFPVAIQFKGNGFYTTDYARRSTIGSGASRGAEPDSPSTTSCATAESSKTESVKSTASTPADSTSKSD